MLTPCFPILAAGGSMLGAILGIGFLIFVHEFGHYLACRLTKTRVETFSIGFGKRLFGWERLPGQPRRFTLGRRQLDAREHAMDFRVALVPLGGYVKMAGENIGEDRSGAPDEFPSKPLSARVFIVSAGVIMNAIAAFVLYLVAFSAGVEQQPPVAGTVVPGGACDLAGMQTGDRIISLNGRDVRDFTAVRKASALLRPDRPVPAIVEREGKRLELTVVPRYEPVRGIVQINVGPSYVLRVEQDGREITIGAADRATIAGIPVHGAHEATEVLETALSLGHETVEIVLADGTSLTVRAEPATEAVTPRYKVGISREFRLVVDYPGRPVTAAAGDAPLPDPADAPGAQTGLKKGDVLLAAITGEGRRTLSSAIDLASLPFVAPLTALEVERGGETVRIDVDAPDAAAVSDLFRHVGIGAEPHELVRVQPVETGCIAAHVDGSFHRYVSVPSAEAGLQRGDAVLRIGSQDIKSYEDILAMLGTITEPKPLDVLVRGIDGETRTLTITPVAVEPLTSPRIEKVQVLEPFQTDNLFHAAGLALARTGVEITDVFRLIGSLFRGDLSFRKNIAGPVQIVGISSKVADVSWLSFLLFLAYISVTLAVLNILPIPVLDGGHLMFMLIEKIRGKPLKDSTIGWMQSVGLVLLLVLMIFAFWNDFRYLT